MSLPGIHVQPSHHLTPFQETPQGYLPVSFVLHGSTYKTTVCMGLHICPNENSHYLKEILLAILDGKCRDTNHSFT